MYTIKDLEHLSGIKAHTLRIWEQRYGLLSPERTGGNRERLYSDNDMRHLLNVSVLNRNGFKISRISEMSRGDVEAEVSRLATDGQSFDVQIDALIVAMADMREMRFEELFNAALRQHGFEETMMRVIFPFMRRIGIMWQVGSIVPAQEHFISNLVRQKIIASIDKQDTRVNPGSRTVLLFLPEGELHELSLLFTQYIFRSYGHRTVYLGQSVPFSDLESVAETTKPDIVFSVFTSYPRESDIDSYAKKLRDLFVTQPIVLAGMQTQKLQLTDNDRVMVLPTIESTLAFVSEFSANPSKVVSYA